MKPFDLIEKAFLLKNTTIFKSLDLDALLSIAEKLELTTYPPQTKIFDIGEEALHLYLIIEGQITIKNQELQTTISSGEFFGDEHLFSGKRRTYLAESLSQITVISLLKSQLYSIISQCPNIALQWLESYAKHTTFRPR